MYVSKSLECMVLSRAKKKANQELILQVIEQLHTDTDCLVCIRMCTACIRM